MSLIYMITTTDSSVVANGIVPLTTIARRKGCAVQNGANSVILTKPGYYKVTGTVTYTAPVAGDVTFVVQKNGVAVPGLTSSQTVTTATTEINTAAFSGIVRVLCSESGATLTVVDTGVAITTSNVSLSVEYLG